MNSRDKHTTVLETGKRGNVTVKGNLKNGIRDGLWQYYDAAGRVIMEEHYKEGKLDGIFRSYYASGTVLGYGHYENDKRHGEFTIFNEDGSLRETRVYEHGDLVKTSVVNDQKDKSANWPA